MACIWLLVVLSGEQKLSTVSSFTNLLCADLQEFWDRGVLGFGYSVNA